MRNLKRNKKKLKKWMKKKRRYIYCKSFNDEQDLLQDESRKMSLSNKEAYLTKRDIFLTHPVCSKKRRMSTF